LSSSSAGAVAFVLAASCTAGGLRLASSPSAAAAALSFNEIDLDDCGYDETSALYTHSCRCGAELMVDEASLRRGVDLFPCSQCSIVYRVLFEWEPDEEADAEEEEAADAQQVAIPSEKA
jgi:hypothetical protein